MDVISSAIYGNSILVLALSERIGTDGATDGSAMQCAVLIVLLLALTLLILPIMRSIVVYIVGRISKLKERLRKLLS